MTALFRGAGLFDLQVNGYAGIDFNDASLTADGVDHALEAMRMSGVIGCLPTLITATREDLAARIAALDAAVSTSRLGPQMVPGYHLEGPFLNDAPGYAGCHPPGAMTNPDAGYIETLGRHLSCPILLVTLAPERDGAPEAIRALVRAGMAVAIGHSAADFGDIRNAVDAGLTLSTHLGNGLPQSLPKLDNTLLAQLSEPRLAACLIADGVHISSDALRALVRLKGVENCILVTDAVVAAASPPGQFRFAGMIVESDRMGVVRDPGKDHLAGSSLRLDAAVRNVVAWEITTLNRAVAMASSQPLAALSYTFARHRIKLDPGEVEWDDNMTPRIVRGGGRHI